MSIRVLFVITCLDTGGAERQLAYLLECLQKKGVESGVVSLRSGGAISRDIAALGIPVWNLVLDNPLQLVRAAGRLFSIGRHFRPEVIQGWMYHGNLAAYVASRKAGLSVPVFWSIRQSLYDLKKEKKMTQMIIRLGAKGSGKVNGITYNATISRSQHEAIGFSDDNGCVIPNGFDGEAWRPDEEARHAVRDSLGIPQDVQLIGLVSRYHPVKGHDVFLDAARQIAARRQNVEFLLAGKGVDRNNPLFQKELSEGSLAGRLHLLGEQEDIPRLTAALDIATSSSRAEGFPNAVAEALLCGIPVVATDVGESKQIVGNSGVVVPPGNSLALYEAWDQLLELDSDKRRRMGLEARWRLLRSYTIDVVADRYMSLYEQEINRA